MLVKPCAARWRRRAGASPAAIELSAFSVVSLVVVRDHGIVAATRDDGPTTDLVSLTGEQPRQRSGRLHTPI